MSDEKGSVTLEAAIIIPVIFIVIISLIYASFYLHDYVVLKAICTDYCGRYMRDELSETEVAINIKKESEKALYITKDVGITAEKGRDTVIDLKGKISIPFNEMYSVFGMDNIDVIFNKKKKLDKGKIYEKKIIKDLEW